MGGVLVLLQRREHVQPNLERREVAQRTASGGDLHRDIVPHSADDHRELGTGGLYPAGPERTAYGRGIGLARTAARGWHTADTVRGMLAALHVDVHGYTKHARAPHVRPHTGRADGYAIPATADAVGLYHRAAGTDKHRIRCVCIGAHPADLAAMDVPADHTGCGAVVRHTEQRAV